MALLEDMRSDEECAPIFKLTEVAQLYKVRLEQLGLAVEKLIHTTRLKKRLLATLPDLRAHSQGRDILLSFEKDIGLALMAASYHDTNAMHLMREYAKRSWTVVSPSMGHSRRTTSRKNPSWL